MGAVAAAGGQEWAMQTMSAIGDTFTKMEQTSVGGKMVVVGSTYYDEISENPCGVHVYSPSADLWEKVECEGEERGGEREGRREERECLIEKRL